MLQSTPAGRILNRFSKDQESIDSNLPMVISQFLNCLAGVITTLGFICAALPWFTVAIAPTSFVFYIYTSISISHLLGLYAVYMYLRFLQYYRRTSRELKRLDSISRSPIFSSFSETLSGLATIRAFVLYLTVMSFF